MIGQLFITGILSYLLGSISSGIIIAKTYKSVNLREMGSRNTGASNVMRLIGVKPGVVTFIGDFIKAIIACFIGKFLAGENGVYIAGLCCIIGHNWPVYYKFNGGKGVACTTAIILFTFPYPAALVAILACLVIIIVTRMISLGSITMVIVFMAMVMFQTSLSPVASIWAIIIAGLCIIRHVSNIKRVIAGTENKLGSKAEKPD